jgi:hypothetical protein
MILSEKSATFRDHAMVLEFRPLASPQAFPAQLAWIEPPAPFKGRPGASILFCFRVGSGQAQAIGGFPGRHVQSLVGFDPDHPGRFLNLCTAKGQYGCPFFFMSENAACRKQRLREYGISKQYYSGISVAPVWGLAAARALA